MTVETAKLRIARFCLLLDGFLVNCNCRFFRACITRILDDLTKAEFNHGPERSLGSVKEKSQTKKKKNKTSQTSKSKRYADAETQQSTMDEELQDKKDIAKEYMVINNGNWGKISAMMLATKTQDREIIAHDLCWRVIRNIWRNGRIRQPACIFTYSTVFSNCFCYHSVIFDMLCLLK